MQKITKFTFLPTALAVLLLLLLLRTEAQAMRPAGMKMHLGYPVQVTADDSSTDGKYTWKSDNPAVLTVSPTNTHTVFLYPHSVGRAVITVDYRVSRPGLNYNTITGKYEHTTVVDSVHDYAVFMVLGEGESAEVAPSRVEGEIGEDVSGTITAIRPCGEGLVPVKRNGIWGYANSNLQLVIPFQYDKAENFSIGGIAEVAVGDVPCVINTKGEFIFQFEDDGLKNKKVSMTVLETCFNVGIDYDTSMGVGRESHWYDLEGNTLTAKNGLHEIRAKGGDLRKELGDFGAYEQKELWDLYCGDVNIKVPRPSGYKLMNNAYLGDDTDGYHLYSGYVQDGLLIVQDPESMKMGGVDLQGNIVIPCEYDILYQSRNGYVSYKKGSRCGVLKNPVSRQDDTLIYNANGGSGAPAGRVLVKAGETAQIPGTIPTCSNMYFAGWAERPDAAAAEYLPGEEYTLDKSMFLYAIWTGPDPEVASWQARDGETVVGLLAPYDYLGRGPHILAATYGSDGKMGRIYTAELDRAAQAAVFQAELDERSLLFVLGAGYAPQCAKLGLEQNKRA